MLVATKNNRNWLPEVFNEFFGNDFMMPRTVINTTPAINVIEHKDTYLVELAAPGMTREDFKVTLNEEQNLVIEIEKKTQVEENNEETADTGKYLRREFTLTKFKKVFALPEDVNLEAINATALNGVLTVALPKIMPEEQKREVKEIVIN